MTALSRDASWVGSQFNGLADAFPLNIGEEEEVTSAPGLGSVIAKASVAGVSQRSPGRRSAPGIASRAQ